MKTMVQKHSGILFIYKENQERDSQGFMLNYCQLTDSLRREGVVTNQLYTL